MNRWMNIYESYLRGRHLLVVAFAAISLLLTATTAPSQSTAPPLEIVLVDAGPLKSELVSQWKNEGFKAVAIVLDDRAGEAVYREMARGISEGGLEIYCWIEVGRNPKLAAAHPRWMASLGMHEDWQKNFPNVPEPGVSEVAKAFPWVPICYQETFDAHLERIGQLLKRAPPGWRGLLLNDLQGGPSSCGCGNLQCRWAGDYHVRSTATKLEGSDIAGKFIAEVRKRAGDKQVIPVWATECEAVDLPADKHQGRPGTGLCGTVGCATGACPDVFTRQWTGLTSVHEGPIGVLGLHTALQRTQTAFGGGAGWVTNALAYLDQTLPASGGKPVPRARFWVVVEGSGSGEEKEAREAAAKAGVGAVIVARARIDQSYEPRIIHSD